MRFKDNYLGFQKTPSEIMSGVPLHIFFMSKLKSFGIAPTSPTAEAYHTKEISSLKRSRLRVSIASDAATNLRGPLGLYSTIPTQSGRPLGPLLNELKSLLGTSAARIWRICDLARPLDTRETANPVCT